MYRTVIAFAAAVLLSAAPSFAAVGDAIPKAVVHDLHQQFTQATDVRWSSGNSYYKASVNMQGKYMDVYYNRDGSFIGISRNISTDHLPLVLLKDVQAHKANFYVAELFELVTEQGGTEYYITYKNGMETKVYRGNANGWSAYRVNRSSGKEPMF